MGIAGNFPRIPAEHNKYTMGTLLGVRPIVPCKGGGDVYIHLYTVLLFYGNACCKVRVPGRSPFSQLILHETDKSKVVRKTKSIQHQRLKGQTNERINQTNSKQNNPPRSSESKTRGPFRSQVIDGALEEEEDRRRAVIGFKIPVTRARIRS